MNYKRCKMVCGIMICSLMITSVTACGTAANDNSTATGTEITSTSEGNTFTYTDSEEDAPVSTTVMAKVDSVSGNEVTLSVGSGAPGQPDGNASDENAPGSNAPGGDAPNGEAPDNNNGDNTPPEKPVESSDGTEGSGDTSDKPADAPQKPDESSDSTESSGDASNKPDGQPGGNAPADMQQTSAILTINDESVISVQGSDKSVTDGSLDDITEGSMLEITFDEDGAITKIVVSEGMGGDAPNGQPGNDASGVDSYDAATEYTEDTTAENESYSSTGTDENAILVSNGTTVNLKNSTIDRTFSDSTGGDNSSFYGVGAAVLTTDGTTYLSNANITTDAAGGAGVFAYGNGSDCTFTADDQDMQGGIIWDSISQLDFYMTNGSTLTGYFADDETYAGDGGDGYCNVVISKDSTWTVTGDSTITSLSNEGTIVDESGNTVSIVGTDGTVYVEGTSSYTITVDSYNDSADLSGAATADSWSNHEVAKPESM